MPEPGFSSDRTPPAARARERFGLWAAHLVFVLAMALALLRAEPAPAAGGLPAAGLEKPDAVLMARDACTRGGPRMDGGSDGPALALPGAGTAPERRMAAAAPGAVPGVAIHARRWTRLEARGPPRPVG